MAKEPNLAEIAARIDEHLKRIERDPKLNPWDNGKVHGTRPFFHSGAFARGSRVGVMYVSYQGTTHMKKVDALKYLAWLDAGNVGKHWNMT